MSLPITDNREIIPTRPRNMAVHITIFDAVPSSAVMPSDDPTVNRADKVSNTTDLTGSSGSSQSITITYTESDSTDIPITALALRTEPEAIVRL